MNQELKPRDAVQTRSEECNTEIMDALVRSYHVHQLRLRGLVRKNLKDAPAKVLVLNQFYDKKESLPRGLDMETEHPDLTNHANAIVAAGVTFYLARERAIVALSFAQKAALASIGTKFGSMMKDDAAGAVDHRFRRYRRLSNEFRRTRLDGKFLGSFVWDEDGPMFKAFAKAAGFEKPAKLACHVRAALGMRNGTVPVTLDGAIELGLTTYP